MNWKILLVSVVAIISVLILGSLQVIGIPLATILSTSIGIIGIAVSLIGDLNKPNISLKIEKPEFEKRNYGEAIRGYKLITKVSNKGKKIVYNLEASILSNTQINVVKISISSRNKKETYTSSNQKFDPKNYSWIDENGKDTKTALFDSLRKDDEVKLMFPKENQSGLGYGFFGGRGAVTTFSHSSDLLFIIDPEKTYKLEIQVKGEDNDKVTVCKTKTFKLKIKNG